MNNTLVSNYNKVVGIDDTVLWLGDCFFKGDTSRYSNILSEMAGNKILIVGNHDQGDTTMAAMGFTLVMSEAVMSISGVPCRLNHYPYYKERDIDNETPDRFKHKRPRRQAGEILLHGHNHTKSKITGPASVNVGVDAWNFGPAPYEEVVKLVRGLAGKTDSAPPSTKRSTPWVSQDGK